MFESECQVRQGVRGHVSGPQELSHESLALPDPFGQISLPDIAPFHQTGDQFGRFRGERFLLEYSAIFGVLAKFTLRICSGSILSLFLTKP